MALFIKYEFWGNYLQELRAAAYPHISSPRYSASRRFSARGVACSARCPVLHPYFCTGRQLDASPVRHRCIYNVSVAGDTRFDRVTDIMRERPDVPQAEAISEDSPCLTIVAGSTVAAR